MMQFFSIYSLILLPDRRPQYSTTSPRGEVNRVPLWLTYANTSDGQIDEPWLSKILPHWKIADKVHSAAFPLVQPNNAPSADQRNVSATCVTQLKKTSSFDNWKVCDCQLNPGFSFAAAVCRFYRQMQSNPVSPIYLAPFGTAWQWVSRQVQWLKNLCVTGWQIPNSIVRVVL